VDLVEQPDRLGHVLEDVARDDEVLALVVERFEAVDVEVAHDVGVRELDALAELGEQPAVLVGQQAVDIAHLRPGEVQGERDVCRTELDAAADQVPAEEVSNVRAVLPGGYFRHWGPA
jgi:hypothetical protein